MERIELSQERVNDMFAQGEAMQWARNVVNKVELSEEEKAFSAHMNDLVEKSWKYGNTQAREAIAEVIIKVIEPEIFASPSEILTDIFDFAAYGEFDKIKTRYSYKNTLVAREAAKAGNVDKSYIDFTKGNVVEKHLQLETQIRMSDLRRDGAVGVAQLSMYALAAFEEKRFTIAMDFIDELLAGGDNTFAYAGSLTKTAMDELTGYAVDNCFDGIPTVIGLSNAMREASRVTGMENYYSSAMKDKLNNISMLDVYNGCRLVSIKAGKKNGEGETLLPTGLFIAICGKIGKIYAA